MKETEHQKVARDAALEKACKEREERIKAENNERAMFRAIRGRLLDLAALASGLECGWVDTHGKALFGDKAEAKRRVLAASRAIDNTDENESLRALLCDILRCLRANMLRKKIVFDSKDAAEFEQMLDGWSDRTAKIEKGE